MVDGDRYRSFMKAAWDAVNIYESPEIFASTFGAVRREEGLVYAAHFCQSEVCNGGFDQFFFNITGVLAPEAVEGFTAIGQVEIADLVQQAMKLLGERYLRDRFERQSALDLLPDDSLEELDRKFFTLIGTEAGGFEVAADRYASTTLE
jgi:hypothetical protein